MPHPSACAHSCLCNYAPWDSTCSCADCSVDADRRAALTAFLVDVLSALGQGDNLMAREHLGLVGLLAAFVTEGLIAGVAEVHGVHFLRANGVHTCE